jgi:hypothetical protein
MKSIRARLPSPAMVVAVIALFSSLGGVSYGLAKGSINGREVRNKSLTGKDMRTDSVGGRVVKESDLGQVPSSALANQTIGVTHFAAVNNEGVPIAARGVLNSFATSGDGDYRVTFDKTINTCAYMATIVSAGPVAGALRGQIGVGLSNADPRALQVQTTNAQGQPAQRPFHVAVLC